MEHYNKSWVIAYILVRLTKLKASAQPLWCIITLMNYPKADKKLVWLFGTEFSGGRKSSYMLT